AVRDREEFLGLVEVLSGLDEDRGIDPGRVEERCAIIRRERPADRGQLVRQPRIVGAGRVQEMVMGVDDHASPPIGGGASGRMRPSARRSSHNAGGIDSRMKAGYSSSWSTLRTPATRLCTAGWASVNWMAAARSGTSWRAQITPIRCARSI